MDDTNAGQWHDADTSAAHSHLAGLRIALVHDWLTGRRGGEKCLEVLCEAFPEATLHTLVHRVGAAGPIIERMRIQTSALQRIPHAPRHYRALLPLMPLAARGWNVGPVDLVVSLSHCVAKAVRVPPGVPHVCYCFTPMRYAWEGRAAYIDRWRKRPVRRWLASAALNRLQAWDRATAARVTHFVAISETVRERIRRCYSRESTVICPPVDVDFYTPAPVPREPFYLVVSALVPYKRIDDAIKACRALNRRLVIIGAGPDHARLERLTGTGIQLLGWQPDDVVRDHLRRCRALLFPGLEDFGIVPLEALACATPVIALGAGGAAENIDNRVGALYSVEGHQSLQHAIAAWENAGYPCDPAEARHRAERLSTRQFRARLLRHLAAVASGAEPRTHAPLHRPHWTKRTRRAAPAMPHRHTL